MSQNILSKLISYFFLKKKNTSAQYDIDIKKDTENNGAEGPEISSCIFGRRIFGKVPRQFNKDVHFL